jgi:hypothetical protein
LDFQFDKKITNKFLEGVYMIAFWYLMPLSTIFQLYHGNQF